jgi:AraC-like DNA-binding protein
MKPSITELKVKRAELVASAAAQRQSHEQSQAAIQVAIDAGASDASVAKLLAASEETRRLVDIADRRITAADRQIADAERAAEEERIRSVGRGAQVASAEIDKATAEWNRIAERAGELLAAIERGMAKIRDAHAVRTAAGEGWPSDVPLPALPDGLSLQTLVAAVKLPAGVGLGAVDDNKSFWPRRG